MCAEETDQGKKDDILRAHRNFVRDAIYFLYENNRMADAAKWFKYLVEKYPDMPVIDNHPDSLPKNLTLDEYVLAVVNIDISETSQERVTSLLQGLLLHSYEDLAIGQDDRAAGFQLLAAKIYAHYLTKVGPAQARVALPSLNDLKRNVLGQLLDTQRGLPYAARAVIRTQLGMTAETNAPPRTVPTNSVAPAVLPAPTNSPATNAAGR
jgi:hypothetical protein